VSADKVGNVLPKKETAMCQDIMLTVDYHDKNCVIRRLDRAAGDERVMTVPTSESELSRVVHEAWSEVQQRPGRVIWIQESTTGWARVKQLVEPYALFVLANVLQMPLPPKARRRKTDKVDTSRLQREYLAGTLPLAHQPPDSWRQARRLVALRESLVNRRTALTNWITRYLAHETWVDRQGLWSERGERRLRTLSLPALDRRIVDWKLLELKHLAAHLQEVEDAILELYVAWPLAQRLDAIRGIAVVSAVSILARIGPVQRFRNAEHLIAFAGLAPGIQQSDQTRRAGRIGGGGTDKHLRHYLIEATIWARDIPRYRGTYERMVKRRGKKIGRLVVARLLVRSIYKMLRDDVPFQDVA
jgi:transposase